MAVPEAKKPKTITDFNALLKLVEKKRVSRRLDFIYGQVPDFLCDRCGKCCFNCAETYFLEFLQIYDHLRSLPQEQQRPIIRRLVQYELFNLMTLDYECPFLEAGGEEGACLIYEVRPLACRFFGLYPDKEYQDMQLDSRRSNEELAEFYSKNYSLFLPDSVISYDVDQCDRGKDEDEEAVRMSYYERGRLQRMAVNLEDDIIPPEVGRVQGETQRFSYLFVRTFFSDHDFFNLKLGLMRRFKEGLDEEEIDDITKKIISQYRIKL